MSDLDSGGTLKGLLGGQIVFGRYTLTRILGRGGMGVVWLARDGKLDREVALKFLPETVVLDPRAIDDLKRETRRALELTHEHIVRIYDFVDDPRHAAISMEYVDGNSLSKLALEQPHRCFEPDDLRTWLQQLTAALTYAHTKAKVVHRDLKPANLMVDDRGDLKIADFGIAASITDTVSRTSRQEGSSGTPVYMSPQQMMGEKAAATDDIYSLGATLYELLTGKPPFYSGRIEPQVLNKVPPSMAERRRELEVAGAVIPPEWEETIAACLAKEAADRPQSAAEVAERLGLGGGIRGNGTAATLFPARSEAAPHKLVVQMPATNESAAQASRSKVPLFGGVAVAVLALAGLGWYLGLHLPEQKLLAEIARLERAGQDLRLEAAMEKIPGPEQGRVWTILELGLVMQPIAPGTYQMGGSISDQSDELPVTQVTITKHYWLGATEVTQGQWESVMGKNPSKFKGANLPVEQVSYDDAMDFCRKLTERERTAGRLPEGYVYTLPTEAQWEYACRAGTTGDYAGSLDAMGWYNSNCGGSSKPVGTKQANGWGLYDMHGNVWEWCLDWHGDYPGGSVNDPTGPASGSFRVNRGGSWDDTAFSCRSANRFRGDPRYSGGELGFRVALSSVR